MSDDEVGLKRNPFKKIINVIKHYDESGKLATSPLNFNGEEAHHSTLPALFFLGVQGLIILRLVVMITHMLHYHEQIYAQGYYIQDLHHLDEIKVVEKLQFDFAASIVDEAGHILNYDETFFKMQVFL